MVLKINLNKDRDALLFEGALTMKKDMEYNLCLSVYQYYDTEASETRSALLSIC